MAKTVKAATTRIAATLTARYTPAAGAADAFFLDGRMNGRREQRAADITLDREDRGFFYAAYANAGAQGAAGADGATPARRALDRMLQNMKQTGRNIDNEINELADTAVETIGHNSLQRGSMRQPYFAGVIVRDSELAAITMGGGCAYLYRNNVLYPLTTDDYPLEPIDRDGNPVDRLNIYCAGVAGTVRYSNIAQLQVDDCVIVCNRELMEAIGQRELLRLLDEAEDQCDAAGMVMTAASAKLPGTSLQFLIGFVETIAPMEKAQRFAGRANGTSASSGYGTGSGTGSIGPSATSGMGGTGAIGTIGASGAGMAAGSAYGHGRDTKGTGAGISAASPLENSAPMPSLKTGFKVMPDDGAGAVMSMGQTAGLSGTGRGRRSAVEQESQAMADAEHDAYPFDDVGGDDFETVSRGRKIAFYSVIALVSIACLFAIYSMLFRKPANTGVTTRKTTAVTTSAATTTAGAAVTTTTTAAISSTTTKASGSSQSATTASQSGGIALPAKHTVASGDTLTSISRKYYGASTPELWKLIRDANGMTTDSLKLGQVLTIPAKP